MRIATVVCVVGLAFLACGGPDETAPPVAAQPAVTYSSGGGGGGTSSTSTTTNALNGRFTGPLSGSGACSDGSSGPMDPVAADWVLDVKTTGLEIETSGNCDTILADVNGSRATMRQKNCPSYSSGGYNYAPAVKTGSVSVSGSSLAVTLKFHIITTGIATGFCDATFSGTLTRHP